MSGLEGLLIGRVLGGRYRVEEVIGRGGMGAVYRGVDERLGRRVAVKVVTVAGAHDPEARERLRARFYREARAAAALPHHPNVVPVYDYGTDEALGIDYIVMELLRGQDLATRLARAGIPPLGAALRILFEASRGVAVGHRAGLIHRDVKPGNIFLAESDHGEVQVRMVDFGIAKLADDEDTFSQLTQDGRAPHSPAYASPEQLRGLTQLTAASDVFSLGAVGYQLLTGERPYSEADRNRMSLGMPVPPPSARQRNPEIPDRVEEVVARALAFDLHDRYPDAVTMAAELGRALREMPDEPVEPYLAGAVLEPAAPPPVDEPTQFFGGDDDRTLLAPPGPDAVLLPPRPATPPEYADPAARAPIPPRPLAPEPRRGIGGVLVWALVLLVLAGAGVWAFLEWGGAAGTRVAVQDSLPAPPDSLPGLAPDVSVDPSGPGTELDAMINNQDGLSFYRAGRYDEALVQFRRAVQISPENAEYRRNLGLALQRLNLPDEAVAEFGRAIELDPSLSLAYANLAEAQTALGDLDAAIAAYEEFLARSTDPVARGRAERNLRDLRAARDMAPPDTAPPAATPVGPDSIPLLGDSVGGA